MSEANPCVRIRALEGEAREIRLTELGQRLQWSGAYVGNCFGGGAASHASRNVEGLALSQA